jgi:hypothetical protein
VLQVPALAGHKMDRLSLLEQIDEVLGGGPRHWSDVLLVRNVGPLLTSVPRAGDNISNRGFNAIVFAPAGDPTHFLKVRSVAHDGFTREASVTVQLSAQPQLAALVPTSCTFFAGPARILALEFIEGLALDVLIRARHAPAWHELAADVLRSTVPLREAIGALSSEVPADHAQVLSWRADLDLLASLGLDVAVTRELAARLDAVTLAMWPQHGDFWPHNILKVASGWRVLDYESCGEAATPLFDVFHVIRGCAESSGGGRGDWIERWIEAGTAARPLADEVRSAARGFDHVSIEASLVAYKVKFTATLHRRGIARERIAVHLTELAALPGQLDQGVMRRLLG